MYETIFIIHRLILLLGAIIPVIIIFAINKKNSYIGKKELMLSNFVILTMFVVFAKCFQFILDKVYEDISVIQLFNIKYIISFIASGYTFFGGYVGSLLAIFLMNKKFKTNPKMSFWFVNNLNIMYAIMKLGCLLGGCCCGFTVIPIQLLESVISLVIYVFMIIIYINNKQPNKSIGLSIILFSTERFIISFYRAYMTNLAFWGTEIISIVLIFIGSIIYLKNKKEEKR